MKISKEQLYALALGLGILFITRFITSVLTMIYNVNLIHSVEISQWENASKLPLSKFIYSFSTIFYFAGAVFTGYVVAKKVKSNSFIIAGLVGIISSVLSIVVMFGMLYATYINYPGETPLSQTVFMFHLPYIIIESVKLIAALLIGAAIVHVRKRK